jgi:hypothetical protein
MDPKAETIQAYTKKVAILQSNYIPWKGYFDLIHSVDEFVLFDTAQYTRRDWRNRNRIKTPAGLAWLTIPVVVKGRYLQTVQETEVSDPSWAEQHWKTLKHSYARAPYFDQYRGHFEGLYLGCEEKLLSQINYRFLTEICEILGIKTRLSWSAQYRQIEGKTERLVAWCKELKAVEYLSGPAARDYIDQRVFDEAGVKLQYFDYSGYPEYKQLYPPFDHAVSIVDLIFNEGPNATRFMKSF